MEPADLRARLARTRDRLGAVGRLNPIDAGYKAACEIAWAELDEIVRELEAAGGMINRVLIAPEDASPPTKLSDIIDPEGRPRAPWRDLVVTPEEDEAWRHKGA